MAPSAIVAAALAFLAGWKAVRVVLAFRGNTSPAARQRALAYFTPGEIESGKRNSRPYYIPGLLAYVIELGVLWALVYLGIARRLEDLAQAAPWLPLQAGLFLGLLLLAEGVPRAPLSIYSGFLLRKRLGVLRQSFGQWAMFTLKGVAVNFVLLWVAVTVFIGLVRAFPGSWWLPASAILTLLAIGLTFIQPVLLSPLFYRFTRLEGPMRDRLLGICRAAGVRARDVFVQHESTVTTHSNAYFAGIGGSKRIVVYDNLLGRNTSDEVATVVAHEAGHWAHHHILLSTVLAAASILAGSLLLFGLFSLHGAEGFFGTSPGRLSVLPVLALLGLGAEALTEPFAAMLSRRLERQADRAALGLTADPEAFISVQVKLVRDNKADVLPHPLLVRLYASHPEPLERIRMAHEFEKEKAPGQPEGTEGATRVHREVR